MKSAECSLTPSCLTKAPFLSREIGLLSFPICLTRGGSASTVDSCSWKVGGTEMKSTTPNLIESVSDCHLAGLAAAPSTIDRRRLTEAKGMICMIGIWRYAKDWLEGLKEIFSWWAVLEHQIVTSYIFFKLVPFAFLVNPQWHAQIQSSTFFEVQGPISSLKNGNYLDSQNHNHGPFGIKRAMRWTGYIGSCSSFQVMDRHLPGIGDQARYMAIK